MVCVYVGMEAMVIDLCFVPLIMTIWLPAALLPTGLHCTGHVSQARLEAV